MDAEAVEAYLEGGQGVFGNLAGSSLYRIDVTSSWQRASEEAMAAAETDLTNPPFEADLDFSTGRFKTFDTVEEFLASLKKPW